VLSALRARLSFANVMSVIALFLSLGGAGYAAGVVPFNSVGTAQLQNDAVNSSKVKNRTLKAVDFAHGQLKAGPRGAAGAAGPAGPAGPTSTPDPALFYTQAQENARYLGGALVTVVASSATVNPGTFGLATATCPAGYQVISGGEDPQTVGGLMDLATSEPLIEDTNLFSLVDGQHGAPTAWRVYMANGGLGTPATFKVAAVCAPLG